MELLAIWDTMKLIWLKSNVVPTVQQTTEAGLLIVHITQRLLNVDVGVFPSLCDDQWDGAAKSRLPITMMSHERLESPWDLLFVQQFILADINKEQNSSSFGK